MFTPAPSLLDLLLVALLLRLILLVVHIRGVGDAEKNGSQDTAHELEAAILQDHDDGLLEGACRGADAEGDGRVEGAARDGAPGIAGDGDTSADGKAKIIAGVGRGGHRHGQDDVAEQEGEGHLNDAQGLHAVALAGPEREGLARIDEGVRHRGELSSGQLCPNITRSALERHVGRTPREENGKGHRWVEVCPGDTAKGVDHGHERRCDGVPSGRRFRENIQAHSQHEHVGA
mmetsp:Transcript_7750/g.21673  ORF Transcript_7750/g.21673 Transcript_7750/m.21673 type:complete len:232 (+) Transcript_7750:250-945(+)